MTIEEAKRSDKPFLTAEEVGSILGMNPQSIRDAAKYRPDLLGFSVIRVGSRTKIPRKPFIKYIEGE